MAEAHCSPFQMPFAAWVWNLTNLMVEIRPTMSDLIKNKQKQKQKTEKEK